MYKNLILLTLLLTNITFANEKDVVLPNLFEATYDSYYEGKHVGLMNRNFEKTKENSYILKSTSDIKGYYGIIPVKDKREEVSKFNVLNGGVYQPTSYRMDRTGTWLDFVMDIKFDNKKGVIDFSYKDRKEKKPIVGEVLDNALFQLKLQQEIKNGNRDSVRYDIAYKTGFRDFHFKYIGNEKVDTKFGKIDTIKYMQVRDNKDGSKKAVYSWFDPNNDYVMVQFLYVNKKGKEEALFKIKNYKQK